ncbi:hypothetical protein F511_24073 [Dorcoceras hygrometricum]|uniref:Uncharacterized protein n=1 Tax=Dorcoceras hygrometricum TaxID=472368 RepID=A0A2Z7BGD5_9LAMI|nr:hypothetical protein F511_24073 [Dorcoceras hygrometricum]
MFSKEEYDVWKKDSYVFQGGVRRLEERFLCFPRRSTTSGRKIPMFSKEEYDVWKIQMQAPLAAQDGDMWFVITDGPMKIMKTNTAIAISAGAPQWIEKTRMEWTSEDKKKANLDNVDKDILYKTLDNNMFSKIQTCTTAKEIFEKMTQIYEGNEKTKENKLTVTLQKFELIRMKPEETLCSAPKPIGPHK